MVSKCKRSEIDRNLNLTFMNLVRRWATPAFLRTNVGLFSLFKDQREEREDRIAQSKRARAGSLGIVKKPQVARACFLRANVVVLSFSGVTHFCFVSFSTFCFH